MVMERAFFMMAPPWLEERAIGGYSALDLDDPTLDDDGLRSVLRNVELERVLQGRYIRISLGSVSSGLAFYIVYRILRDSWRAQQLSNRPGVKRFSFLHRLHHADVFPLVLGITIFISTMVMIGIQSGSLQTITAEDCKATGSFALPALLSLGYLHFIFGLETAVRALRSSPFSHRHRFTPVFNVGIYVIILIITLIVAKTIGVDQDRCIGNIVFRASSLQLNRGVVAFLGIMILSSLIMATIIAVQLLKTIHLDPNVRVTESRMVYYLLVGAILQLFVLPFFVQSYFTAMDDELTASTVADYALFSTGAVLAFLHLFLRANASRSVIKARETPWQRHRGFRLFGPSDLEVMNISRPLNLVNNYDPDEKVAEIYARQQSLKRKASVPRTPLPKFSYPNTPTSTVKTPKTPRTPEPVAPAKSWPLPDDGLPPLPQTPRDGLPSSPKANLTTSPIKKTQTYGLFPGGDDLKLPATVYTPPSISKTPAPARLPATRFEPSKNASPLASNPLTAPSVTDVSNPFASSNPLTAPSVTDISNPFADSRLAPPGAPWAHRRGSSSDSTATVQIGIRMSSVGSGLFSSKRQSAIPPRIGNVREEVSSFNGKFPDTLQDQMQGQSGRDLNSFRWIDTPVEERRESDTLGAAAMFGMSPRRRSVSVSRLTTEWPMGSETGRSVESAREERKRDFF